MSPEDGDACKARLNRNSEILRRALATFARSSVVTDALWKSADDQACGGPSSEVSPPGSLASVIRSLPARLLAGPLDLFELRHWFGGGEGLTPAFDDFCAGLLLADIRVARQTGQGRRIQAGEELFRAIALGTTEVAWWQLRFAAEGSSSLAFEQFLERLFAGEITICDAVRVMALGHSSGSDLVSGIWCRLHNLRWNVSRI